MILGSHLRRHGHVLSEIHTPFIARTDYYTAVKDAVLTMFPNERFKTFYFLFNYECIQCMCVRVGAHGVQKRVQGPLEL